ncbi:Hypothetical predicted protein, partial [Prunus dulcis]
DCIGAIDGTHISAWAPTSKQIPHRGRKVKVTQNIMCAYSFNMLFTYVYTGWEGTANDSKVLMDAIRRGRHPRGAMELFYYRHSSLRNVIERCFGVLKARFPIL